MSHSLQTPVKIVIKRGTLSENWTALALVYLEGIAVLSINHWAQNEELHGVFFFVIIELLFYENP